MENEVKTVEIPDIVGKTIIKIEREEDFETDVLVFHFKDGHKLTFYHDFDCCESVYIKDICGSLKDLCRFPLLKAYYSTREATAEETSECGEWTFYHFSTQKGTVTIQWYGESNGYYSTAVSMCYEDAEENTLWEA